MHGNKKNTYQDVIQPRANLLAVHSLGTRLRQPERYDAFTLVDPTESYSGTSDMTVAPDFSDSHGFQL